MTPQLSEEQKNDRRWSYKNVLTQIRENPPYLMQFAEFEKASLQDAFLILDERIRALEAQLAEKPKA